MQSIDGKLLYSATDLSTYLACGHASLLGRAEANGLAKRPYYDDPLLDALRQRGLEHEQAYLARLTGTAGMRVALVPDPGRDVARFQRYATRMAATIAAMRSGVDVVYQGCFIRDGWLGFPDFLLRVPQPSALGDWSYEIADTKLAREAKAGAVLQLMVYADLLAAVQGRAPERVHLALGGPEQRTEAFRVAEFAAYYRSVKRRFETLAACDVAIPVAPDPVTHCDVCVWSQRCDRERRDVDHLSLVAGVTRAQRRALVARDVATVQTLAAFPIPARPRLEGVGDVALERVREQARIQVEGRRSNTPVHELLVPITPEEGLAALPAPSPGDVFFDIEGDPFALTHGLEYLFGWADARGEYEALWALDREAEKAAFERFVDFVIARLEQYPDMHVYHYAPYEPTALKRLMGLHASCEDEVDRLLRANVMIDLYRVVRQGLRASVESYSIKRLEPFYGFTRDVDMQRVNRAKPEFEAALELGAVASVEPLRAEVEGYNRDDVGSTRCLRDWLEQLRVQAGRETGAPVPRPAPADGAAPPAVEEEQGQVAELTRALMAGVPVDETARTREQQARWLMAQLLGFHRREKKSTWWEYFRCLDLNAEELIEDRATMGGLEYVGVIREVMRSNVHRYTFPAQEHDIDEGKRPRDADTKAAVGEVVEVDDVARTIDIKRGKSSDVPHPRALVPLNDVDDRVMRTRLRLVARAVLDHGFDRANPFRSAADLLLARAPRAGQPAGAPLMAAGESPLDAARRLVLSLDDTVLPIQGPPGSGKTFTGARMIVTLLRAGRRVGVTATSHKVISNLLRAVDAAARDEGLAFTGVQKCDDDQWCDVAGIEAAGSNDRVLEALQAGEALLAAGTAWLWSREAMTGSVDVLFVDEAGQFSLANALAVAPAAASLVLLGDPRQLEQPRQGVHPPGSEVSALDHLLGGHVTITPERGLFLPETWRLHPDICGFTSEIFYESRLAPRADLHAQTVNGAGRLSGHGLRFVPVAHAGNTNESAEEVEVVARLVADLTSAGATWTDRFGERRQLTLNDVLIVAPYNAHVSAIAAHVEGARVGTVDRFQGQETPVVIYSMATSSAEDAPRGMDFLYSPNRLNVATSRARCLAVIVASPLLFAPECRSPEQMRLANAFCRYLELATAAPPEQAVTATM